MHTTNKDSGFLARGIAFLMVAFIFFTCYGNHAACNRTAAGSSSPVRWGPVRGCQVYVGVKWVRADTLSTIAK